MTEREKMTEIIQKVLTRDVDTIERKAERMTNALIGAGFMSDETRHKWIVRAQEMIKGIEYARVHEVNARNYAFHRAEVAERALLFLCDKTMRDISVMVFPSTKTQVRNKQELYDYCIEQAERELAEEGKDG